VCAHVRTPLRKTSEKRKSIANTPGAQQKRTKRRKKANKPMGGPVKEQVNGEDTDCEDGYDTAGEDTDCENEAPLSAAADSEHSTASASASSSSSSSSAAAAEGEEEAPAAPAAPEAEDDEEGDEQFFDAEKKLAELEAQRLKEEKEGIAHDPKAEGRRSSLYEKAKEILHPKTVLGGVFGLLKTAVGICTSPFSLYPTSFTRVTSCCMCRKQTSTVLYPFISDTPYATAPLFSLCQHCLRVPMCVCVCADAVRCVLRWAVAKWPATKRRSKRWSRNSKASKMKWPPSASNSPLPRPPATK
jgi:hypothetical protein